MKSSDRNPRRVPEREQAGTAGSVDRFRAQHMSLSAREVMAEGHLASVLVNDSESPLAWLARRKGRDGRAMISSEQFVAGEKLRTDFTRGHLSPRVTSDWSATTGRKPRGSSNGAGEMTDMVIASRQRVRLALEACGPEFSGLLMDVCCFLRGLEDVEHERGWPPRSAKVVLQLALDRLARHYGFLRPAQSDAGARLRTWLAEDASFTSG